MKIIFQIPKYQLWDSKLGGNSQTNGSREAGNLLAGLGAFNVYQLLDESRDSRQSKSPFLSSPGLFRLKISLGSSIWLKPKKRHSPAVLAFHFKWISENKKENF